MANQRKHRLGKTEKDILNQLSSGDFLFGVLLSAGSGYRAHKLARERAMYRYRRKLAIERLAELNYIRERSGRLTITDNGRNAIGTAVDKTLALLKSRKWDGKWRIVAFDIPETHAKLRNKVRAILKRAHFVKLQHSVWIFPHECRELVQLIKDESGLSKFILYGVLENIEDEGRIRKLFRL